MPNLCVCIGGTVGHCIPDKHHFRIVAQAALSMTLPLTARSSTNATDARELMNAGLSRQEATCLLVATSGTDYGRRRPRGLHAVVSAHNRAHGQVDHMRALLREQVLHDGCRAYVGLPIRVARALTRSRSCQLVGFQVFVEEGDDPLAGVFRGGLVIAHVDHSHGP